MSQQANPPRATQPPAQQPTFEPMPPLQPHRRLFVGLMVIFLLWVGVLLWLFFTTVWPLRHSLTATRPALP